MTFALAPQLAWAGPPADTLAPAMPEPAPVEPAPSEPAPSEPSTSEPSALEPAPSVEPASEPASGDALPTWDTAEPAVEQVYEEEYEYAPPLREVPRDGKGAMVFGSFLAVGGLAATSLGVAALADGWAGWGVSGISFGVPVAGVGIGVTALGVKRHRAYRKWESSTDLRPPPSGRGLLGAGFGTMFGGTSLLVVAGMSTLMFWQRHWWEPTGYIVGGLSVVTSIGLLIAGSARNGRFNTWKKGAPLPTASIGPHGFTVGVAGRF
jgi:hypothetical protein